MKILIVDDEISILRILIRVFKDHEVTTAEDTHEAYDLLLCDEYDVILSDYKLPSGNGLEMLKVISRTHPNTRLYLMTGSDINVDNKFLSGFIRKPFDIAEIRRKLCVN